MPHQHLIHIFLLIHCRKSCYFEDIVMLWIFRFRTIFNLFQVWPPAIFGLKVTAFTKSVTSFFRHPVEITICHNILYCLLLFDWYLMISYLLLLYYNKTWFCFMYADAGVEADMFNVQFQWHLMCVLCILLGDNVFLYLLYVVLITFIHQLQ